MSNAFKFCRLKKKVHDISQLGTIRSVIDLRGPKWAGGWEGEGGHAEQWLLWPGEGREALATGCTSHRLTLWH